MYQCDVLDTPIPLFVQKDKTVVMHIQFVLKIVSPTYSSLKYIQLCTADFLKGLTFNMMYRQFSSTCLNLDDYLHQIEKMHIMYSYFLKKHSKKRQLQRKTWQMVRFVLLGNVTTIVSSVRKETWCLRNNHFKCQKDNYC